jgi:hypothetical protein
MTDKILTNKQGVKISHENLVKLRSNNLIRLGVVNELATKLTVLRDIVPTKTTASKAFQFWNWVAILSFFASIYWTFTEYWWSFIVGLIVMRLVWNANKKANAENYLDAAMIDKEFYEKVMGLDGWIYQIKESNTSQVLQIIGETINKEDVVSDFINQFSKLDMLIFWDETKLCHPKEKIQEALLGEIKATIDEKQKEHLKIALIYTCQFIKDLGEPIQLSINQHLDGVKTQEMTDEELKEFARRYIETKTENNDEKYSKLRKQAEAEYAQLISRLN